jgi:hypothetical protein
LVDPPLTGTVPAALLMSGDRLLNARSYLTDGYGIRRRIESLPGTPRFRDLADVWQPSRLKGFTVPEGRNSIPFLSAGQVFEARPRPRKWLAEKTTPKLDRRRVEPAWLLLSCSGVVGRTTAVYNHHLHTVITHDLLRVVPFDAESYGWLYAYMRTPTFVAQAVTAQYGHMIKHLDAERLQALPVPMPAAARRKEIADLAARGITLRREALGLLDAANNTYELALNPQSEPIAAPCWGVVPALEVLSGRRRLDAQYHHPAVRKIEEMVRKAAEKVQLVEDVTRGVSLGSRFKRFFGPNGTPYYSASDLFDVNAPATKRIYAGLVDNAGEFLLHRGWLAMACSGQTYGLLGRTTLLGPRHEGVFGSHDLIRIEPDAERIRTGYLATVLGNEKYGRPLVVRNAFGTSVPHLDPADVRKIPVPRLGRRVEEAIADDCEEAFRLLGLADQTETEATDQAQRAVTQLLDQHLVRGNDE